MPPLRCTDDPRDSCLPANGGRDCLGTCVRIDGHYQLQQFEVRLGDVLAIKDEFIEAGPD